MISRVTVILRHNTVMPGDAKLARREWANLLGTNGALLAKSDLSALYPVGLVASIPKTATAFDWVAESWTNPPFAAVVAIIRKSAFAQEILISGDDNDLAKLQEMVGAPICKTDHLRSNLIVALGHYYVIETEAVLPPNFYKDRIAAVVRALLEPYQSGRETVLSRKLRSAKKTTLSLSHDLHIYKAKFFPRMVRALINIFGKDASIFDPFCGSGTALLEASLLGHDAVGVDIDPICVMMSRSKVESFVSDRDSVKEALYNFMSDVEEGKTSGEFIFPDELEKKIARRDRIDGSSYLASIKRETSIIAYAVERNATSGLPVELVRTLSSDAVTKKIRYRFIGVGNGRYTIEIVKQPLLDRLEEKILRSIQLFDVFEDLESELKIRLGRVSVEEGDARNSSSWPSLPVNTFTITSPPYLPASSGREHYASSRALSFAVLGFNAGENGYFDNNVAKIAFSDFSEKTEAGKLMGYLLSDTDDCADPQRDAMRFQRKAIPTAHYLGDLEKFASSLADCCPSSCLALVVADQHTFYSHRRGEIEHVVDCAALYGEILECAALSFSEEIEIQLLKSAASRAKPRAKDDYHEAVLIFETPPSSIDNRMSIQDSARQEPLGAF